MNVQESHTRLKVLVVDDDAFQLELMRDLLQDLGVREITLASSGREALASVENRLTAPDLLICDLHMPGMDGFQFMESIANLAYAGALLIVSGQDSRVLYSAGLVAQLRRFNFLGSIEKPVALSKLEAILAKVVPRQAGKSVANQDAL